MLHWLILVSHFSRLSIMSSGRDKSKQGGSDETYQKPRRLDEETANYLLQIEPQLKALNSSPVKGKGDEMNESDENDGIEKEVLVGNVLEEIKHHEASAMSDRRTNLILEKLCYASSLNYLVDIITSITPYAVFLARDRYSSHCLQVNIELFIVNVSTAFNISLCNILLIQATFLLCTGTFCKILLYTEKFWR